MASTHLARPAPTCLSCIRRIAQPSSSQSTPFSLVQTRGVKGLSKAELEDLKGIPVRLLTDMPSFGRKDAIIRVKAGKMRNQWFPKAQAEYMTQKRLKELGLTEAAIGTRDRTFGTRFSVKEEGGTKKMKQVKPAKKKETLTLPAEETQALLSTLLSPTLQFSRRPIDKSSPTSSEELRQAADRFDEMTADRRSPSLAANAESLNTVPEPVKKDPNAPVPIYGSVSTSDILATIRDVLSTDDNGARVALEAEAISIKGLAEGEDRIKTTGRFEVEIYPAKGMEPVRRTIEVVPEQS